MRVTLRRQAEKPGGTRLQAANLTNKYNQELETSSRRLVQDDPVVESLWAEAVSDGFFYLDNDIRELITMKLFTILKHDPGIFSGLVSETNLARP